jgi:uncharacterized membrane protein YkvA (DUF1232 family)
MMNLRERAKQIKKDIPAVFLLLKKRKTPWYAKALAILTIGYALSPICVFRIIRTVFPGVSGQ